MMAWRAEARGLMVPILVLVVLGTTLVRASLMQCPSHARLHATNSSVRVMRNRYVGCFKNDRNGCDDFDRFVARCANATTWQHASLTAQCVFKIGSPETPAGTCAQYCTLQGSTCIRSIMAAAGAGGACIANESHAATLRPATQTCNEKHREQICECAPKSVPVVRALAKAYTYEQCLQKAKDLLPEKAKDLLPDMEYQVSKDALTWAEHEQRAQAWGGHLASITSAEEDAKVRALAKTHGLGSVYLGGTRKGRGKGHGIVEKGATHWKWSDGTAWVFENWDTNQPDNNGFSQDRTVYWHLAAAASKWDDQGSGGKIGAVYKRRVACAGISGYAQICNIPTNMWDSRISNLDERACTVNVATKGGTCKAYCESQGTTCLRAQDNSDEGLCKLSSDHTRETMDDTGCLQEFYDQVCVCAPLRGTRSVSWYESPSTVGYFGLEGFGLGFGQARCFVSASAFAMDKVADQECEGEMHQGNRLGGDSRLAVYEHRWESMRLESVCLCLPGYFHGAAFYRKGSAARRLLGSVDDSTGQHITGSTVRLLLPHNDSTASDALWEQVELVSLNPSLRYAGYPQQYADHDPDGACSKCPEGTQCDMNGTTVQGLVVKPGFWRVNEFSAVIETCDVPSACAGGDTAELIRFGSCAPPYRPYLDATTANRTAPIVTCSFASNLSSNSERIPTVEECMLEAHARGVDFSAENDPKSPAGCFELTLAANAIKGYSTMLNKIFWNSNATGLFRHQSQSLRVVTSKVCKDAAIARDLSFVEENSDLWPGGCYLYVPWASDVVRVAPMSKANTILSPRIHWNAAVGARENPYPDSALVAPVYVASATVARPVFRAQASYFLVPLETDSACATRQYSSYNGTCHDCPDTTQEQYPACANAALGDGVLCDASLATCGDTKWARPCGGKIYRRYNDIDRAHDAAIATPHPRLQNPLCTGCSPGFFRTFSDTCISCSSIQFYFLFALVFGGAFACWCGRCVCRRLRCSCVNGGGGLAAKLRLVATAMQVMVQMSVVLDIVYPVPVRAVLELIRVPLSLDIFNVLPRECVGERNYASTHEEARLGSLGAAFGALVCLCFMGLNSAASRLLERNPTKRSLDFGLRMRTAIVLLSFGNLALFATPWFMTLKYEHGRLQQHQGTSVMDFHYFTWTYRPAAFRYAAYVSVTAVVFLMLFLLPWLNCRRCCCRCRVGDRITMFLSGTVTLRNVFDILFLLQPPMVAYVARKLACRSFDDGARLTPSTRYSSPCLRFGELAAYDWALGILPWVLGVSLFYTVLLWTHRGDICDDKWRQRGADADVYGHHDARDASRLAAAQAAYAAASAKYLAARAYRQAMWGSVNCWETRHFMLRLKAGDVTGHKVDGGSSEDTIFGVAGSMDRYEVGEEVDMRSGYVPGYELDLELSFNGAGAILVYSSKVQQYPNDVRSNVIGVPVGAVLVAVDSEDTSKMTPFDLYNALYAPVIEEQRPEGAAVGKEEDTDGATTTQGGNADGGSEGEERGLANSGERSRSTRQSLLRRHNASVAGAGIRFKIGDRVRILGTNSVGTVVRDKGPNTDHSRSLLLDCSTKKECLIMRRKVRDVEHVDKFDVPDTQFKPHAFFRGKGKRERRFIRATFAIPARRNQAVVSLHWALVHAHGDAIDTAMGASASCKAEMIGHPLLIHYALKRGHDVCTKWLVEQEAGVDVSAQDSGGNVSLHVAARYNNVDIMRALIERGANCNAQNNRGETPLHVAVQQKHPEAVKLLLESGALCDAETTVPMAMFGVTPLLMCKRELEKAKLGPDDIRRCQECRDLLRQNGAVLLLQKHFPEDWWDTLWPRLTIERIMSTARIWWNYVDDDSIGQLPIMRRVYDPERFFENRNPIVVLFGLFYIICIVILAMLEAAVEVVLPSLCVFCVQAAVLGTMAVTYALACCIILVAFYLAQFLSSTIVFSYPTRHFIQRARARSLRWPRVLRPIAWLGHIVVFVLYLMCYPIVFTAPDRSEARGPRLSVFTFELKRLYIVYKPAYWWYELVMVLYRLFMVGMLALVAPGTNGQVGLGIAVELVCSWLLFWLSPHKEAMDRKLALSAHGSVMGWLIVSLMQRLNHESGGTMFKDDNSFMTAYFMLLFASPLFLLYIVCVEACCGRTRRADPDLERGVPNNDNSQAVEEMATNPIVSQGMQRKSSTGPPAMGQKQLSLLITKDGIAKKRQWPHGQRSEI